MHMLLEVGILTIDDRCSTSSVTHPLILSFVEHSSPKMTEYLWQLLDILFNPC